MEREDIDALVKIYNSPDKDNSVVARTFLETIDLKENLIEILLVWKSTPNFNIEDFDENFKEEIGKLAGSYSIPSFYQIGELIRNDYKHKKHLFKHYIEKFIKLHMDNLDLSDIIDNIDVKVTLKNLEK